MDHDLTYGVINMNWLAPFTALADIGKTWMNNRKEISLAQHQRQLTMIETNADWESQMAKASATSWKDEWFTIVLSTPLIAIMVGAGTDNLELIERVKQGFIVLSELPQWYQYLLGMAVTASFGIKGYDIISNRGNNNGNS